MASNQANLKNARKQLDAEMAMQHATQSALDASVASGQRGAPWQPGAIVEGAQGSANPPPHRGSLHCRRRRRRGIHGLDWGEPEGEVLKPTALGDPEQHEGTVRSPGSLRTASARGVSTTALIMAGKARSRPAAMSRCANPVSISSLLCSAVSRAADKTPSYWPSQCSSLRRISQPPRGLPARHAAR